MANALSLLRLFLVVPFAWLLARGDAGSALWAATLFCVAIASDLADGPLARARGTASGVGRALDHVADFAFVDAGLLTAASRGALPWLLPVLVAVAFLQYVVDSYWLQRAGELRMSGLGRWNGVLYFAPLGGVLLVDLGAGALAEPNRWLAWALCASTLLSIADRALSLRSVASEST
ncbi:MAG TPA: CDP-alcohol phosphatidyltransferase family protein [Myxococcota bacterium]|nr:CDP-alcohol phosphatidyltransferase family protein [Myxococcota bacterium]